MTINEFDHPDHGFKWRQCEIAWIESKIAEAVAAEREACAKVCDDLVYAMDHGGNKYRRPAHAEHCAAKIRERRVMGIEYEAPLSAADGIGCPGCGIQPLVSETRADTCCTVRNVHAEETKMSMTLRSKPELQICRRCGGRMSAGEALDDVLSGVPDYPGDNDCVTVSPSGKARMIGCLKCERCGHSVTAKDM